MNKRKLVLLSLILPVLVSSSAQANPWKNALKRAGYASATVLALYTGYQAAKAFGLFGQPELAQAPAAPVQNQLGIKTAQQLLEENQIKLIDARLTQRAASKEAAAQKAKAQEEARAHKALAEKLQDEREIAAHQKAQYDRNITAQRGLLEARDLELRKLRTQVSGQEIELQQLRQRLEEAYTAQTAPYQELPAAVQQEPAENSNEKCRQLYADILKHQTELKAAEQAFARIKPHIESNNTQVFKPFAETETLISSAVVASNTFTQDIKFEDLVSNSLAVEYAQGTLDSLKAVSQRVYGSFNGIRRELQRINDSYSTYGWNYKTKAQIQKDIQMFDEFVSAFSRLIN